MAKRKVTDDQLRTIVKARLTKGSAFMMDHETYLTNQQTTANHLADLDRAEIFRRYPEYTYDLR